MAFYVVSVAKWNGEGAHIHETIGLTNDKDVAHDLMVEKALFMAKLHGHLKNGDLTHQSKFGREETVHLRNVQNLGDVFNDLKAANLADDDEIRITHGKKGFSLKVKLVPLYDASNVNRAPVDWVRKLREKLETKRQKLQEHLANLGREEHETIRRTEMKPAIMAQAAALFVRSSRVPGYSGLRIGEMERPSVFEAAESVGRTSPIVPGSVRPPSPSRAVGRAHV